MLELDIAPTQVDRKIRNLTDQQSDDYSRIAGRMVKMQLDKIVQSEVLRKGRQPKPTLGIDLSNGRATDPFSCAIGRGSLTPLS